MCKWQISFPFSVDDGTGVISCIQWRKVDDSDEGLTIPTLGQLVSVFGKVTEFHNERQLTVSSVCLETDPNVEPLFWMEVIKLKREIYSKPFVIPPGIDTCSAVPELNIPDMIYAELKNWLDTYYSSKNFSLKELEEKDMLTECCMKAVQDQAPQHSKSDVQLAIKTSLAKLIEEGFFVRAGTTIRGVQLYKVCHANVVVDNQC